MQEEAERNKKRKEKKPYTSILNPISITLIILVFLMFACAGLFIWNGAGTHNVARLAIGILLLSWGCWLVFDSKAHTELKAAPLEVAFFTIWGDRKKWRPVAGRIYTAPSLPFNVKHEVVSMAHKTIVIPLKDIYSVEEVPHSGNATITYVPDMYALPQFVDMSKEALEELLIESVTPIVKKICRTLGHKSIRDAIVAVGQESINKQVRDIIDGDERDNPEFPIDIMSTTITLNAHDGIIVANEINVETEMNSRTINRLAAEKYYVLNNGITDPSKMVSIEECNEMVTEEWLATSGNMNAVRMSDGSGEKGGNAGVHRRVEMNVNTKANQRRKK